MESWTFRELQNECKARALRPCSGRGVNKARLIDMLNHQPQPAAPQPAAPQPAAPSIESEELSEQDLFFLRRAGRHNLTVPTPSTAPSIGSELQAMRVGLIDAVLRKREEGEDDEADFLLRAYGIPAIVESQMVQNILMYALTDHELQRIRNGEVVIQYKEGLSPSLYLRVGSLNPL